MQNKFWIPPQIQYTDSKEKWNNHVGAIQYGHI